jgi:rubrerythrin
MHHLGTNEATTPRCPDDGFPMSATIVGWRCPICGQIAMSSPA